MTHIVVDGIVFETQDRGGISRIYHEIFPRICQLDQSVQFMVLTAGQLEQTVPKHTCIQHHALNYWEMLLRPGRFFRRARRRGRVRAQSNWLEKHQFDIWHSTYYTLPLQWRGPVVITAYDLNYFRFPQMYGKQQDEWTRSQIGRSVLDADVVICISATTKADLLQLYDVDSAKLQVIPLGVGSVFREIEAENLPGLDERLFLLYVGKRGGYKNFATLLEAYSRWPARCEINLLVVGSPWTKEEVQQMRDFGVSANVRLETDVIDQELALLYNQAAAFVYPSLYEGFGLPLLEAMACGCPVVASNIPTSKEVAGDVAFYFEPDSVDDLLLALDNAVSNGRSASRSKRGVRLASAYSWDNSARQTLEVYHALA